MDPLDVVYKLWDVWLVSWVVAAIWTARTVARPIPWAELWRDAIALAGAIILFSYSAPETGQALLSSLWVVPAPLGWMLVAVGAGGLSFCWWARVHLGRLWSGLVAVKTDHRVVETGPYRFVRHPIYSGLLSVAAVMAVLKGTPSALAGLVLVTIGLWLKAALEERFLRAALGAEAYDSYSRRTPMLVPLPR